MSRSEAWVLLPAAGSGSRLPGPVPKLYLPLAARSVIECTLERVLAFEGLRGAVVSVARGDRRWPRVARRYPDVLVAPGGASRADSVRAALAALDGRADDGDWVMVHDAARPCVTPAMMRRLLDAVRDHPVGGLLAVPVDETLKRADATGAVARTEPRARLWRAQTPQAFRAGMLRVALSPPRHGGSADAPPSDESAALERLGHRPLLVPGSAENLKITRPGDLGLAEAIWRGQGALRCG